MTVLTLDDFDAYGVSVADEQVEAMIADAIAQATLVAPCLKDEARLDHDQTAQFRAVLRGVVLRWIDAGNGAVTSLMETMGPFARQQTVDSSKLRKGLFWPSEIDLLQQICRGGPGRKSATVDTSPDRRAWPGAA